MSSLSFKNQKYTKEEILQALKDIDKGQYKFSCKDAKATKYVLSYENKEYAIKQVCECLSLNRGIKISPQDHCDNEILRKRFIKMGFTIVAKYLNSSSQNNSNEEQEPSKQPLNQILYGPPGTGKTYDTIRCAVAAIENKSYDEIKKEDYIEVKKRYDGYKINGRIEFVTFHQSYSYEEFIEGIKPEIQAESVDLKYLLKDGVFKKICGISSSLSFFEDAKFEEAYNNFIKKYIDQEKIILKTPSGANFAVRINKNFSLTIITGKNLDQETSGSITKEQIKYQTYTSIGRKGYLDGVTEYLCNEFHLDKKKQKNNDLNYVLIIDEINRGNISKIFGELITLIEDDKRETMTVTLPYSQDPFTVPKNLYIIGTMNTADKSLALLDVALRRRFEFKPMYPKYYPEVNYANKAYSNVLKAINDAILAKNKPADYLIGHSYFMGKADLKDIFNNKVIPLLMEYFNNKREEVEGLLNVLNDEKVCELKFGGNSKYYLEVVEATVKELQKE